MENTEINTTQTETFTVTREIKLYLAETAKWGIYWPLSAMLQWE